MAATAAAVVAGAAAGEPRRPGRPGRQGVVERLAAGAAATVSVLVAGREL